MKKREDGRNAQYVATQKYASKAYDRIGLNVKKGNRKIIREYAEKNGYSLNGYINKLLSENVPNFKL